ncbi:MAG: RNA polymerase sigma factor [Candidatus Aminicenantia bacterium]
MEEKEIISRCLSGEIEVFEILVRKYQANVLSLTWNILGDKEEAKDITQEAFIQAYVNLNRFDMTRSFKNWLYSIAYKRCLDRKRKEKSLAKFIKKIIKEERLSDELKTKQRRIEDSEIFNPILNELNEKERTAISLKVNEGYSAREIAQVLNCAESTARVHLFNAKRKLKKVLKEKKDDL